MASAEPGPGEPLSLSAKPRPSSTVVVVRPGTAAPEVLMVRRHAKAAFGSAYAFPGGVLEPGDAAVTDACHGMSPGQACEALTLDQDGLAYYSAAIRELFEETGVLLGTASLAAADRAAARDALNAGTLAWERFIADAGVQLDCAALHYFSFWITPEGEPKRYSTRFFLAELPAGQVAAHCGGELTDSRWMTAAAALEARKAGEIRIIYPTRKTLESVSRFDAVEPLIDWARGCAAAGVACDQPARVPV